MNIWRIVEIALGILGVLMLLGGESLDQPVLTYAGFCMIGATAATIGLEAIIKRRIVLPSRYHRYMNETYVGPAAMAQGVLFILTGGFFVGVSILAYYDTGRAVFLSFVRHPGPALILFGLWCLLTAVIALVGYVEQKETPKWVYILDMITSRVLPGLILVIIAVGAIGLGVYEIVAPRAFDEMGGGFLEVLYGVR